MFLRWMGRSDRLDLGLWGKTSSMRGSLHSKVFIHPKQLIVPVDTHVARISRYIGLTQRKTMNWKMALEITKELRKLDPLDPVKYDFAVSRLGILDECTQRFHPEICGRCSLVKICRYHKSFKGTF